MAVSEAGVCNRALLRIGHRKHINSLSESSTEAQACRDLWDDTRDAVLAEHGWKFATGRKTLALLASVSRAGWTYAYTQPQDCILTRYLTTPGVRTPAGDQTTPFDIEDDDVTGGSIILTDLADAELVYTRRVTNVVRFPAHFVDALAYKLASDLALAIPVKPQVGERMLQAYGLFLERAVARDVNQVQGDPEPETESLRARR